MEFNGLEDAGVIDQNIDAAELPGNFAHHLFHVLRIANIAAYRNGVGAESEQARDGLFGLALGIALGDGNPRPLGSHAQR